MKRKKIYIVIAVLFVVSMITGVSYALWVSTHIQSGENIVTSDCFDVTFEESNTIKLINSFPMYDEEGKKLTPYHLKVRNKCNQDVNYQMNFETTKNTTMRDSYIKLMFQDSNPVLLNTKEKTEVTIENGKSAYLLESGMMKPLEEKEYDIRIWIDEKVTASDEGAMNGVFESKIVFTASHIYHESILNGTDPVLADGLIPVYIKDDGEVIKANLDSPWYKYADQKWANAVILEDESITYQNGETIPEENIESYFVWIPKYRYKLWDLGNYTSLTSLQNKVQTIDIIFGDYDTVDNKEGECKAPGVSGSSGNCSVGDYMTHPAFQAFGTKGLWVGKFETGYKGAISKTEAEQNIHSSDKVEIKPNVYSWRNIQIANAHLNSYNYKREYESHMMKNTEWGAVAYLQHSVYGSRQKVRLNNNSSCITGYAAVDEPTCGYTGDNQDCNRYEGTALNTDGTYTKRYNTEEGYLASTTKNINGIYDMSGGAIELMMGVMLNTSGSPCVGQNSSNTSGFAGPYCGTSGTASGASLPESKYYDVYLYGTTFMDAKRRILGDATGEMGPFGSVIYGSLTRYIGSWYDNSITFVRPEQGWFLRGSSYSTGTESGVFSSDWNLLKVFINGYRIVLAI